MGTALGYLVGGLVGTSYGWRAAFFLEGSIMFPLIVVAYVLPPIKSVRVDTIGRINYKK